MEAITKMLEVFSTVGDWIVETFSSTTALFYAAETGFTFIGGITLVGVAIAIILLVLNTIKDFLHLR